MISSGSKVSAEKLKGNCTILLTLLPSVLTNLTAHVSVMGSFVGCVAQW